ncbi:unnamed protein product [Gongylonema pulchrum]|uniref:UBX domain-containing protein n=1 Tax=Gongylonema pulchrum TaxID=637853 RepID=A0A183DQM3_9BILA|nr:unnamed protein product [Gongylonema pulchrum]
MSCVTFYPITVPQSPVLCKLREEIKLFTKILVKLRGEVDDLENGVGPDAENYENGVDPLRHLDDGSLLLVLDHRGSIKIEAWELEKCDCHFCRYYTLPQRLENLPDHSLGRREAQEQLGGRETMSMLDQLQEMGFERSIAYVPISFAYQEKEAANAPDHPDEKSRSIVEFAEEEPQPQKSSTTETPQAMSFKCDVCGKLLANDQAVMFHAAVSKHDAFSESSEAVKPLSEEEKKERLATLQAKLKEARAKKEEEERREALEKEAEARRRVLEQIRLDREARKAATTGEPQPEVVQRPEPTPPVNVAPVLRDSEFCQLQVRLQDGAVIREKFKSTEPLSHVRLWVEINSRGHSDGMPFTLMMPFPRKVFTREDMEMSLQQLGIAFDS